MLVSEPQSCTVCAPAQCLPPPPACTCLYPKTRQHEMPLWLPLGRAHQGVSLFSLCLWACPFKSLWLWGESLVSCRPFQELI